MKALKLFMLLGTVLSPLINNDAQETPKDVAIVTADAAANLSDDRVLVGICHNVFIGKVISEVGSVMPNGIPIPHTRFRVSVVSNIKGALDGEVFVDAAGGIKDGRLYIMDGVTARDRLQVGSTYLFCTRSPALNEERAYLITRHPTSREKLSNDATMQLSDLKGLADKSDRVKELRSAYENEIIPEAFKADARNSYQKKGAGN